MHFFHLKNSVKNSTKKVKTRKFANIFKTERNIAKSTKFQPWALLSVVLQRIIIGFK